jgi:hypothetical protein
MRHRRELQKHRWPIRCWNPKGGSKSIAQGSMFSLKRTDLWVDQPDNPKLRTGMLTNSLQQKLSMRTDATPGVVVILKTADVSKDEHE